MAIPRKRQFDKKKINTLHIYNRTVRHAFLMRKNDEDENHCVRKSIYLNRFKFLLKVFSMESLSYCIMDNHYHLIIRTRPDLVDSWSREEVARRWWQLYPRKRDAQGHPAVPTQDELDLVFFDQTGRQTPEQRCEVLRERLADVSWFMKSLNEYASKVYNKQENCRGAFWEGRYKSQLLADQSAVLAGSVYVDLNPIRAGLAETPEESAYTSGQVRCRSRIAKRKLEKLRQKCRRKKENQEHRREIQELKNRIEKEANESKWLSPMKAADLSKPYVGVGSLLKVDEEDYLKLLDWTGRQLHKGKVGRIPKDLDSILTRMEVQAENWLETVQKYDHWFYRFVGKVQKITELAKERGKKWLAGTTAAKKAFTIP
ncbi:MAG: hypothetical protein CR997_08510 [Acidobacteria bacterium]|nr:MAG: hypothetical protein CR997_08510 [Acidobacteriota bacterium]